jgi:pimeloyl-ACP methyl ester carboxylesterase
VELRERVFDGGEVAISYVEGPANGPPFVVLHGGSARWQYGRLLLEALSPEWHVYGPDFRGHGKSGHAAGAYRLRDYVRDTAAFLDGVVGEPAVIYGHSLGGEVGVMLAAEHPQLAMALIVGDAPLSTRNHGTERPAHRAQNLLWYRLAGRPVDEIVAQLKDMPVPVPGESSLKPAREVMGEDSAWFDHQAVSLHQLDPDMLAAVLAGPLAMLEGYEPETLLPNITCPVLLVQADPFHGSALSDEDVELGSKLLARVTLLRLDGIGHPLHGPPGGTERIVEAVTPFLREVHMAFRKVRGTKL